MVKIVANLATYPARLEHLRDVLTAITPQVDELNLVLNEFTEAPEQALGFDNVNLIIPTEDTKDVGKFYPDVSHADYVLLIDDDIRYPADFVESTVKRFEALGDGSYMASYHGSIYRRPVMNVKPTANLKHRLKAFLSHLRDLLTYRSRLADHRKVFVFYKEQEQAVVVDQIATCAAILRGADLPSYDYMRDSQKFVDVRLAKWGFEHNIASAVLPRAQGWLEPIRYDETIFHDFTQKNHPHVNDEIKIFAGMQKRLGEVLE